MPANIFSEGFDAGIRFGEQAERDMVAMRVMGEARFVVVASPEYLARHSAPRTPQDLQDHNCIRNRLPNGAIFGWEFQKKGRSIDAKVDGALIVDDIDLSIHAVLDGVGLAYLLYDYIALHIASGRLVLAGGLLAANVGIFSLPFQPPASDRAAAGTDRLPQDGSQAAWA